MFFAKVFDKKKIGRQPKILFATATMTKEYIGLLSALTTIGLPPDAIQWASPEDFAQRNISMEFKCSSEYTRSLNQVVDFIKNDDDHYVCVFVGSKAKSHHVLEKLEYKLNEALSKVDVIHVHGSLHKDEKYWLIRIYCAKIDVEELRGRILLAMPAANVGIDNDLAKLALHLGWPRDLCTYFRCE